MSKILFADTKTLSQTSGFTNLQVSSSSDQTLRSQMEDHINQLYNEAGFPSCTNNRSTRGKLFELLKRDKKASMKRSIPP